MPAIILNDLNAAEQMDQLAMIATQGGFSFSNLLSGFYDNFNLFSQPQYDSYYTPSYNSFFSDFSNPFSSFSSGWFF